MIDTNDIGPASGRGEAGAGSDEVGVIASTSEPTEAANQAAAPAATQSEPVAPVVTSPGIVGPPATSQGPVTAQTAQTGRRAQTAPRRSRVVVRRLEPWSVFKFSLLFYFCLMLIVMFALMILYWIMGLTGVLDSAGRILQNAAFGPPPGKGTFRFNGVWIFQRLFAIGAVGVLVWSLVNLFVALLYNLVSDVVGGISVTLSEKR